VGWVLVLRWVCSSLFLTTRLTLAGSGDFILGPRLLIWAALAPPSFHRDGLRCSTGTGLVQPWAIRCCSMGSAAELSFSAAADAAALGPPLAACFCMSILSHAVALCMPLVPRRAVSCGGLPGWVVWGCGGDCGWWWGIVGGSLRRDMAVLPAGGLGGGLGARGGAVMGGGGGGGRGLAIWRLGPGPRMASSRSCRLRVPSSRAPYPCRTSSRGSAPIRPSAASPTCGRCDRRASSAIRPPARRPPVAAGKGRQFGYDR
jgi:hypothetical protein